MFLAMPIPDNKNIIYLYHLDLLMRAEGATLDQMVSATGWLPHSTRAVLTGLRKKGHVLSSGKQGDGVRIYRITPVPVPEDAA